MDCTSVQQQWTGWQCTIGVVDEKKTLVHQARGIGGNGLLLRETSQSPITSNRQARIANDERLQSTEQRIDLRRHERV